MGNLVNRVVGLIEQNNLEINFEKNQSSWKKNHDQFKKELSMIDEFRFDEKLKYIWSIIGQADGYISETKPWELAKNGQQEQLTAILNRIAADIILVAQMLLPYLPVTAKKIDEIFKVKKISSR